MSHILLHRFNGEPLFVGKAHIRSFGDRWICIGEREDVAVAESIKEIAQALNLMTYELEPSPAPVPATSDVVTRLRCIGGKLRTYLHDAAMLYPRDFHQESTLQLIAEWDEAVSDAVKQQTATTQGTPEGAK